MPRGTPNAATSDKQKVTVATVGRLILIEPDTTGTRIDRYGLDVMEMINELRRCLLHLVAGQAGATVISVEVPRAAAVVAAPVAKGKKPAAPTTGARRVKRDELADDLERDAEREGWS